ncbi:MAG: hypothetical protein QM755_17145 [Luteolibacter sp.]
MIAFPSLQQELARQVREARVDHEAFGMPLKVCELAECRATCCHDGVFLEPEEREVIGEVVAAHRERLADYGWQLPEIFQQMADGRWKSVTLPDESPATSFPSHFPKTRCVFLDAEHRCVLQRLAMDEERHPWFWKPISCWMHPIILKPGRRGERPVLTLATPENDPAAHPGYPGFSAFTPCGMPCKEGGPARRTLGAELELLGGLAGRDVCGELSAVAEGP